VTTLALVLAGTAYVARNDAQRRQAQAEDILGFMLGDLRKNLTWLLLYRGRRRPGRPDHAQKPGT
jgi:hypothetical protein